MKQIVEYICEEAGSNWDGSFAVLEDHVKDSAVRLYLLQNKNTRGEIFPPCCNGAEEDLINTLYSDPHKFCREYYAKTKGYKPVECFTAEALSGEESAQLKKAFMSRDTYEITRVFGDAIYRHCEDTLIEACETWADLIKEEYAQGDLTDCAIHDKKEAAYS